MSDEEPTAKAEPSAAPPTVPPLAANPPSSSPSRVGAEPPAVVPLAASPASSSPSRIGAAATSAAAPQAQAPGGSSASAPSAAVANGAGGPRWPSNTPTEAEVHAIVCGTAQAPPELMGFATGGDAAGRLSELELAAVRGEAVPVHGGALAKIAVVRWRLAAAAHLRPRQSAAEIDREAVDALLVEADEGLTVLRALAESTEDQGVKLLLDQENEALAALAVELASTLQATTKTEVREAVQQNRKKYEPVTKKVEAAKPLAFVPARAVRVGEHWPWVLLSVSVCAAVAFHAYRHFSVVPRPVAEGPVRGSVRLPSTPDGATVFRAVSEGSIAESELTQFTVRLNDAGKDVVKIGPDKFAILPMEAARALRDAQGRKPP